MTHHKILQTSAIGVLMLGGLTLSACSNIQAHGDTATAKAIIASCAKGEKVAGVASVDATASGGGNTLSSERLTAIGDLASRVALCGGILKVSAFTSSSAATTTLFEGPIPLQGATDRARARRVGKAVDKVLAEIKAAYPVGVQGLSGGGSDIVAQFRLAAEHARQLGDGHRLRLLVLTDGFQNAGTNVVKAAKSPGGAEQAAAQFEVPDLSGANVTVAGVGKVDGTAPPTKIVDGLKAFYQALCERTGAESCTIVTDHAAGR